MQLLYDTGHQKMYTNKILTTVAMSIHIQFYLPVKFVLEFDLSGSSFNTAWSVSKQSDEILSIIECLFICKKSFSIC